MRGQKQAAVKRERQSVDKLAGECLKSLEDEQEKAFSRLNSILRQAERSHSDILHESRSSNLRLLKSFKIHTQSCQKLMDDTDRDFQKIMERISPSLEAMKVSDSQPEAHSPPSHVRTNTHSGKHRIRS